MLCLAWLLLTLERIAFEKGIGSGGRESARPRWMSLKTALFRRNDSSAAFEMAAFQKQNTLKVTQPSALILSTRPDSQSK